MQLTGKKVVVVGGSSGIGRATAELATREGAEVVIASRSAERLNAATTKLGVKSIASDVTATIASPACSGSVVRSITSRSAS